MQLNCVSKTSRPSSRPTDITLWVTRCASLVVNKLYVK